MRVEDIDKIYFNDDIKSQVTGPNVKEDVKVAALLNIVNHYRERAKELEPIPAEIDAYLRENERDICRSSFGTMERLKTVIGHYRSVATDALVGCERFRDDLHAWLRGMVICMETVGNADTHKEKNARLRGAIEVAESTIAQVIKQRFDFRSTYWNWRDTFGSDFPTRELMRRKNELASEVEDLKRQLAEAKGVPVEEIQAGVAW